MWNKQRNTSLSMQMKWNNSTKGRGKTRNKYVRNGRTPIPKSEVTSQIMNAIRAKNTKPELLVRRALSSRGLYRALILINRRTPQSS